MFAKTASLSIVGMACPISHFRVAFTVTGTPLHLRLKSLANAVGLRVLPFFNKSVSRRSVNALRSSFLLSGMPATVITWLVLIVTKEIY